MSRELGGRGLVAGDIATIKSVEWYRSDTVGVIATDSSRARGSSLRAASLMSSTRTAPSWAGAVCNGRAVGIYEAHRVAGSADVDGVFCFGA